MGLGAGTRAFKAKVVAREDRIVRRGIEAAGELLIAKSPFDTGAFSSNWYVGVGQVRTDLTPATSEQFLHGMDLVPAEAAGKRYFISNSSPQALRLELGFTGEDSLGRYYNQAPLGFVAAAGIEMPRVAASIAQEEASR